MSRNSSVFFVTKEMHVHVDQFTSHRGFTLQTSFMSEYNVVQWVPLTGLWMYPGRYIFTFVLKVCTRNGKLKLCANSKKNLTPSIPLSVLCIPKELQTTQPLPTPTLKSKQDYFIRYFQLHVRQA